MGRSLRPWPFSLTSALVSGLCATIILWHGTSQIRQLVVGCSGRQDVLFSFIGDKNGAFRPTIEHLNSFVRSFRRFNQHARIVIFMTDDHRKGMMKVFNVKMHA